MITFETASGKGLYQQTYLMFRRKCSWSVTYSTSVNAKRWCYLYTFQISDTSALPIDNYRVVSLIYISGFTYQMSFQSCLFWEKCIILFTHILSTLLSQQVENCNDISPHFKTEPEDQIYHNYNYKHV